VLAELAKMELSTILDNFSTEEKNMVRRAGLLSWKTQGAFSKVDPCHHKAENQMTRIKELQHIGKELEEAEKILADILNPQIRSSYDDDDSNRYLLVKPMAIIFFLKTFFCS
jgi:hypothetical protein